MKPLKAIIVAICIVCLVFTISCNDVDTESQSEMSCPANPEGYIALPEDLLPARDENELYGLDSPANPEGYIALPEDLLPAKEEDLSKHLTRSSLISVSINMPCDEEWRNQSNWQGIASSAVEAADDLLFNKFNINFNPSTYQSWNSSNNVYSNALLDEAIRECGKNGKQMMIAFTKQSLPPDGSAGWSKVKAPYQLIYDQGATNNKKVVRHESGHNYGCDHCQNPCFMYSGGPYRYYDQLCDAHYIRIQSNDYIY